MMAGMLNELWLVVVVSVAFGELVDVAGAALGIDAAFLEPVVGAVDDIPGTVAAK